MKWILDLVEKYCPQRSDNDTASRIYASFIQVSHIAETDQTWRGSQAGRVPCLVAPFSSFIPSWLVGVFDSRAYIVFMSIIGSAFDDAEDFRIVIVRLKAASLGFLSYKFSTENGGHSTTIPIISAVVDLARRRT